MADAELMWDFLFKRNQDPKPPNIYAENAAGARASSLIESEPYQDAVRKVREGIHLKWAESPVADVQGQHELRLMLKLLNDLEGNIKEVAMTGKLAAVQIEQSKRK